MVVLDKRKNFEHGKFAEQFRTFSQEVHCVAPAPAASTFSGLVAVGAADGSISFVDFSMFDQQPFFEVATKVIAHDKMRSNFDTTAVLCNSTCSLFSYTRRGVSLQRSCLSLRSFFFFAGNITGHD